MVFATTSGSVIIVCDTNVYKASRDQLNVMLQCNAQQAAATLQRERRVANTMKLIMIAFVISYSPPFVIIIILLVIGYVEICNDHSLLDIYFS